MHGLERDIALPLASLVLVSIITLCYAGFDRASDAAAAPKCLRIFALLLNVALVALCVVLQVGFEQKRADSELQGASTLPRMAKEEMLSGASYLLSLLVVAHSAFVRPKPNTPAYLRLWWLCGMGICLSQIHNHADLNSFRFYVQIIRATAASLLCVIGLVARPPSTCEWSR